MIAFIYKFSVCTVVVYVCTYILCCGCVAGVLDPVVAALN